MNDKTVGGKRERYCRFQLHISAETHRQLTLNKVGTLAAPYFFTDSSILALDTLHTVGVVLSEKGRGERRAGMHARQGRPPLPTCVCRVYCGGGGMIVVWRALSSICRFVERTSE